MSIRNFIAPLFVATLIFSACSKSPAEQENPERYNATTGDSLLYYYGQMRAKEYWRNAEADTTLAGDDSRQEYLKGVKAGVEMVIKNDDVYNQGLLMGLQLALNIEDFEDTYHVTLNPKAVVSGIEYGLANDSLVEESVAQAKFYALLGKMESQKADADKKKAREALKKEAALRGLTMINSDLYGKVITPGSGKPYSKGELVKVDMDIHKKSGSELGIPMVEEIEVGSSYMPAPIVDAIDGMSPGETKEFATTASAFFGQRASQLNLKPYEVLVFTIKTNP